MGLKPDFFASAKGGDHQNVPVANSLCGYNFDGDYKFRIRQPGITTNNASTDRAERMFDNDHPSQEQIPEVDEEE